MDEILKNAIGIKEFNNRMKNVVENSPIITNLFLVGEISGAAERGPHFYFDLKEKNKDGKEYKVHCNCFAFRYKLPETGQLPKDGDMVILEGGANIYDLNGSVAFNVKKIYLMDKEGEAKKQFEKLKKKLLAKGYFDPDKKKLKPQYINNMCVLTSTQGAVIKDICRAARMKNHLIDIFVYDVKVQGPNCATSVIEALKVVDKMGFDVILIARGGGSFEELNGFNDEQLAEEIFKAKTFIASAIGHQTDFTICDWVADKRYQTPTEAGEDLAYDVKELTKNLNSYLDTYKLELKNKYEDYANRVSSTATGVKRILIGKVERQIEKINNVFNQMSAQINKKQYTLEHKLQNYQNILNERNPEKILSRGYYIIEDANKKALLSLEGQTNKEIKIIGAKEKATAVVKEVKKNG